MKQVVGWRNLRKALSEAYEEEFMKFLIKGKFYNEKNLWEMFLKAADEFDKQQSKQIRKRNP